MCLRRVNNWISCYAYKLQLIASSFSKNPFKTYEKDSTIDKNTLSYNFTGKKAPL